MKGWAVAVVLALAACDSGSKGDAASPPGDAPVADAAPAAAKPDAAAALLDRLSAPRQKGRYAPRDDCAAMPGANEFRHALAEAVLRRDAGAIAAMAAPDIRLGFGGDDGRERFLARLKDPRDGLMDELERLLPLGCGPNVAGDLTMPWVFAQDLGDIDGYTANLVTGEDVPLHAAPDDRSAARRRLSWELVELGESPDAGAGFLPVTAPDGTKGFVQRSKLRSLLDYRLLASRKDGAWRITALLAGD